MANTIQTPVLKPKTRFTPLFWILVACTIVTARATGVILYRMSKNIKSKAVPATAVKASPANAPVPNTAEDFSNSQHSNTSDSSKKELVYLYSDRCGWCDRFNPIWNDFSDRYSGTLGIKKIESQNPESKKYDVAGYPTVLLMVNGDHKATFKDERTVENLLKFAKQHE